MNSFKIDVDKLTYPESTAHRVVYCVVCEPKGVKVNTIDAAVKKIPKEMILFGSYDGNTQHSLCFSQLANKLNIFIQSGLKPTKIIYKVDRNYLKHTSLDDITIREWVNVCKEFGLMPKNLKRSFVKDMNYSINIRNLDTNQMYVYLVAARHIQEEASLVRAVLHFYKDLKFDFFVAYAIGHVLCCINTGYSLINVGQPYAYRLSTQEKLKKYDFSTVRINLKSASGLYEFVKNYKPKLTIKTIFDEKKNQTVKKFNIQETVLSMSKMEHYTGVSIEGCHKIKIVKEKKLLEKGVPINDSKQEKNSYTDGNKDDYGIT